MAGVFEPYDVLSSVFEDLDAGRLRIFDIGRGTNGYDVSVHLFSNNVGDNGSTYIDLIAHRHHIRCGGNGRGHYA